VVLLSFSGCSIAQAAASSTPTLGAGSRTVVAVFTPEGANPRGSGTARLLMNAQQQTICFVILVSGIKLPATAADVQRGAAGTRGSIVIPLRPPNAAGIATGCTTAPAQLIAAMLQHPIDYYVNVPNQPYPQGAVRGQLFLCTPDLAC
jgi:hypothetical protein